MQLRNLFILFCLSLVSQIFVVPGSSVYSCFNDRHILRRPLECCKISFLVSCCCCCLCTGIHWIFNEIILWLSQLVQMEKWTRTCQRSCIQSIPMVLQVGHALYAFLRERNFTRLCLENHLIMQISKRMGVVWYHYPDVWIVFFSAIRLNFG